MKNDRKYFLFVLVLFAFFLMLMFLRPDSISWEPTFSVKEKSPFASRAVYEQVVDIFPDQAVEIINIPFAEYTEQRKINQKVNYFLLGQSLRMDKFDTHAMLSFASEGNSVFIATQIFFGDLMDSLGFSPEMNAWTGDNPFTDSDTLYLSFEKGYFPQQKSFSMRPGDNNFYVNVSDTLPDIEVLGRNSAGNPVFIRKKIGDGFIYLHSTPLAFTNFYLLPAKNHEYISRCFSFMPVAPLHWDEFYKFGRNDSNSPIRVILSHPSLRLSWVILIVFTLLYMLFQSKRRQRIIPVIVPFENTTLKFVETLGRLYYNQKDHISLAKKRILYFSEKIRSRFLLSIDFSDSGSAKILSQKSGVYEEDVMNLFRLVHHIQNSSDISPQTLIELNKKIEKFWEQTSIHHRKV